MSQVKKSERLVSVRFPGERMWVKPISVRSKELTGRLVNNPFVYRDIKQGDVIKAVRNEETWEFEKQVSIVERRI